MSVHHFQDARYARYFQDARYARFVIARFGATLASQFLLFATPLIVFQATGSVAKAGLAFAIEWGMGLSALPIAGVLSDRYGGTRIYAIADAVRCVTAISIFVLLSVFPDRAFLIVSLGAGVIAFFHNQAYVSLESVIPKYIPQTEMHKAQSVLQGIEQFSTVAGPVLAVGATMLLPIKYLYPIAAFLFLVSFINIALTKRKDEVSSQTVRRNIVQEIGNGLSIILGSRGLIGIVFYAIFINLVFCTLLAVGAALVTGHYGKPESYFGLATTTAAMLTLLSFASIPLLTKKYSLQVIGNVSFVLVVLGGLCVALASNYWMFLVGFAVVIASDNVTSVYLRTERVKLIPKEHLGKTLGVLILLIGSSYPLSGLLVYYLAPLVGVEQVILITSILCFAANIFIIPVLRREFSPTALVNSAN